MTANLFLSAPVSSTDTVTLDYTPPIPDPFQVVQSSLPFDEAGNDAEAFTARTVTNDTSAPAVVSVALTSDPDATGPDDDTYAIDDVVRATVTFSAAVTVDDMTGASPPMPGARLRRHPEAGRLRQRLGLDGPRVPLRRGGGR